MIILIPLGGIGSRFKKNGYTEPKALIKVFGKPILYYLLDNIPYEYFKKSIVVIPYNKEYSNYRFEGKLKKDYPNIKFKFICLKNNTRGAAETINIALKTIKLIDQPVICLDGDNFYSIDIIKEWNEENKIICFNDANTNPIYSYIKVDGTENKVVDIIEKKKVSNLACTGAYGFKSYLQLIEYTQKVIDNNIIEKDEFYTSVVIKEMIKDNINFSFGEISETNWHCLGTPFQLRLFYNNYPVHSCLTGNLKSNKLRICFDLDNTLVTFPNINGDYATVSPIQKNIDFLKYLKNIGHTIIIYTARRMKTHKGNVGKLMADIGKLTFDTLNKFDIPYDEIYFGKPHANVYIDDLALNCFSDMEKELGFYSDHIKPREFNTLTQNILETYTKKSDDLSGEIYYYRNIPPSVKDMFPILIDFDSNEFKWYTIEKIKGLTTTNLYLSNILTLENLKHIMNSIKRLHQTKIKNNDSEINIYLNYKDKLKQRYENYDYSKFQNHKEIYDCLYEKLSLYETQKLGIKTVIHGDPVMTNILINNFGKIKFIDMRGKLCDKISISGDYLYDWAKLYQSLIGYDKILQEKEVEKEYEVKFIEFFKTYFCDMYSNKTFELLKIITKSLLFTLIPLHNNEKCLKYYNLINSEYLLEIKD